MTTEIPKQYQGSLFVSIYRTLKRRWYACYYSEPAKCVSEEFNRNEALGDKVIRRFSSVNMDFWSAANRLAEQLNKGTASLADENHIELSDILNK
jgi:hypothetical protein